MAQVLDSPLSSPLSTRSVLSLSIGSDPRLALPISNRGSSCGAQGGAIPSEVDPFAWQSSQDDNEHQYDDDDDEHPQHQSDTKSLFFEQSASQLSFKSYDASQQTQTQEVLTQNADFTQMTQDAEAMSQTQSPKSPPFSTPLQVAWGRLMPVSGTPKVDLLPTPPEAATSRSSAAAGARYYSVLGLEQLQPSDVFNVYTLGRSNKCQIMAQKPQHPPRKDNKQERLLDWAYGLISNRHCRIYCTLPEDPRAAARLPGSSNGLAPSSMEVWVEDSSNNGTMINGSILLRKGQKRRLHSGDEISLVNTETLRKKVRDNRTMTKIQQQHSYVFVNVASQTVVQAASKPKAAPKRVFDALPMSSNTKRRKGLVNPRAMNYPPGSRSPVPSSSAARSPLASELGYGVAQPTPKSANCRRPASRLATTRRIEHDYDIRDLLGRGTCGEVRRAIHRQTGQERAVKIISLPPPGLMGRKQEAQQQWRKEADILRGLKHPYIVDLVDVFHTEAHLYLVMELSTGGDLFDRIVTTTKYSEQNSRRVMRRLLSAIHYLHADCQLVHRDLKPENILLASANDPCDVKITDFGVAKSASSDLKTFCGTPSYIAPEVLLRRHTVMAQGRYGKSADMWSLGVILYILLSGTPPYNIDGAAGMDVVLQSNVQIQFPDHHWSNISGEAKDLVKKLLLKDPRKRIAVQQAMDHPWILMEDGDTHRHPLEDPKLIAVTKKRLFCPMPNGPTPVTSAASPHRKPKAKKRKVSMEKGEIRPPSPLVLSVAPIIRPPSRPLSPVENRCSSPSMSPPSSPSSVTKKFVLPKTGNENDENLATMAVEPSVQQQRPQAVTETKAKRQPRQSMKKDGLVKAAELEDDKICSQFSDEEASISSFGNAVPATKGVVKPTCTKVAAPSATKDDCTNKPTKKDAKQVSSNKTKKAGGAAAKKPKSSGTNKSNKSSKIGDADGGSKQTTLGRWFQPIKK